MYHPSRGGVRGGRDQFNWDEVKADKHRENYLGHSVKAPVGRWQKGKDLTWYVNDKKSPVLADEATKAEIKKIKDEEEQAMRELLGLAPKREKRFQGNRLDKHETAELLKRGKNEEDLLPDYAEAERIQGLGFTSAPRHFCSEGASLAQSSLTEKLPQQQHVKQSSEVSPSEESKKHNDYMDEKKRKLEKKEAKEKIKEEKRAAKKEKRKYIEERSYSDRKQARRRHDKSNSSE